MEPGRRAAEKLHDATLIGRQTYDEFAGYWPNADPGDPITGVVNGARKYLVSNTLTEATRTVR